jgi:ABC-type lipoprotein release transport system permease subunit
VLDLATPPSLLVCAFGWLVTVALALGAGLLASVRALNAPPIEVFRRQN